MLILAETIVLCCLFFAICYANTGGDDKNIRSFSSYPDEVQALVRENPALREKIKAPAPAAVFVSNLLLFMIVLYICGIPLRNKEFLHNFLILAFISQILNLFDFLVIDLLWWRHSRRVRFSGTEDRKELYHSPKKYFAAFLRAIPLMLIAAAFSGFLLTLF